MIQEVISFARAEQLEDTTPVTGVVLKITGRLPKFKDLEHAERYYQEGAEVMADALCQSLPQGFRFRLMIELFSRYVKQFGYYQGR